MENQHPCGTRTETKGIDQRLERLEQMQIQMLEQLTKFQQDMKDQMLKVQRNLMSQLTQLLDKGLEKGKNQTVYFRDDNEDPAHFPNFTPTNIQAQPNTYPQRVTVNIRPQYQTSTSTSVNFATGSGSNLKGNLTNPVVLDDLAGAKQARVEFSKQFGDSYKQKEQKWSPQINTSKAPKKRKNEVNDASRYNEGYSKAITASQPRTVASSH
ncbi:uncharacterized protein [Gossypium hirsutum]|uniref:Uncharacterized protein n=1 Tax=Gossypium hirsutum TaxID=3635 RepID=A0ABM3AXP2_GOSHI|nr:uncharacterized protein LOC121222583 [Gossypium hirsutum]